MDKTELKAILESLLFMSTTPLTANQLKKLIASQKKVATEQDSSTEKEELDVAAQLEQQQEKLDQELSPNEIKEILKEAAKEYQENPSHGFELVEVAKGFQFRTKSAMTPYIKKMYQAPPNRLSAPSMETLSIVAYQQPIQRVKVEEIRGVDSGGVLRTLIEKDLVRVVGRSEEAGRPLLYGTTQTFLETFSLARLSDLPTLKDLEALEGSSALSSQSQTEEAQELEQTVVEEEEIDAFEGDDESNKLIDDLENSIRSMKDLEKKIFPSEKKTPPSETPQTPVEEAVPSKEGD